MIQFISSWKSGKHSSLLLVSQEQLQSKKFNFSDKAVQADILAVKQAGQFSADEGELFPLVVGKQIVLLAGVGEESKLTGTALRIVVRKSLSSSFLKKSKEIAIIPFDKSENTGVAVIEGALLGTYAWKKYFTKNQDNQSAGEKQFLFFADRKKAYADAVAVCQGVTLARDLVNDNADVVTSEYFEKTIKELVKGKKNVSLEILNEPQLKAKKLGLHLAVNQGSVKEPKLVIVRYQGAGTKDPYTALVGKGMTFDTGGLNLKPTGSIETMRCDMSGAAAVVGTLKNVLTLGVKRNILFTVGLAENAIDAKSYKPGDVIRGYNGMTVEIGNTDAEGRLVLADAISYLVKNYKPAEIIDIATLTGACVIALGYDYTGLVASDDDLARKLIRASNDTDDRAWRMPNYPEIKDYVKSKIADIKNVGLPRGALGTCTAAEFLRQFTGNTRWAHLDIAGTAFSESGRMYFGVGATGAGVRLLTQYVRQNQE